jgi:hypothetical protein
LPTMGGTTNPKETHINLLYFLTRFIPFGMSLYHRYQNICQAPTMLQRRT